MGELFNPVHAVSFHPFDDTIMVGDDSEVSLLQFDSGEYLRNIDFPAFPVNEIEISQSGFNGAIGYGGVGGEIGLLDLKSGESIGLYVHDDWITDLAFSPTGQILATSAANGTIKVIDAAGTQTEVHNLSHGEWVDSLAVTFAPFEMDLIGHILASSASGEIKLWDIAVPGGELWTVAGHPEDVKSMVFSVEGDVLASGDLNGTIKLWDTATGAELASFQAHSAEIVELGFSPDGRMLASAGSDGTFRLWTAGAPGTP